LPIKENWPLELLGKPEDHGTESEKRYQADIEKGIIKNLIPLVPVIVEIGKWMEARNEAGN
jgi:hypothetical protein